MDLDALFEEDLFILRNQPCQPVRYENAVPFFTSQQIDLYGLPHLWGVDQYQIIELREDAAPFVTDFEMEQARRGSLRPIHHYDRVERFESILYQLIGCRGTVSLEVIEMIREKGYNDDPDHIWDSIRSILKNMGLRRYYNRIPIILDQLGFKRKIHFTDQNLFIAMLVNEFKKISFKFEQLKANLNRTYFPNLRYIAFKLLQHHGAMFEYRIPFLRTPRKEKSMDELWELLKP